MGPPSIDEILPRSPPVGFGQDRDASIFLSAAGASV
jgi:hypothetical protein